MISNNQRRKNLNFMYRLVATKCSDGRCTIERDPLRKRFDVNRFTINVTYKHTLTMLNNLVTTLMVSSKTFIKDGELYTFYFENGSDVTITLQNNSLRISC